MARLKKKSSDSVSLFPFLSILVCLIGTLTLIITGMTVASIGRDQDDESVKQADEYDRKQAVLAKLEAELNQRASGVVAFEALSDQIDAAIKKQGVLTDQLAAKEKAEADLKALTDELADLKRSAASVVSKVKALELKRDEVKAEIANLKRPVAPEVVVLPAERGGDGSKYRPKFIEVTKEGLVLHGRETPLKIPTAKYKTHAEFSKLLEEVKTSTDKQLVFLLREDAYHVLSGLKSFALINDARFGVLPVRGNGKLDLREFKNL